MKIRRVTAGLLLAGILWMGITGCAASEQPSGISDVSSSEGTSATYQEEYPSAGGVDPLFDDEEITSVTPPEPPVTSAPVTAATEAVTAAATTAKPPTTTVVTTAPPETTAPPVTTLAATAPPVTEPPVPQTGSNSYQAVNHTEVKGVWLSYLEYRTMLKGHTKEQFRASIASAFDQMASAGMNTVYIQCRGFGDAFYSSSLFPWSEDVTGTFGQAASFDPVAVMLEEGKARGFSLHAWVNPMRGPTNAQLQSMADTYPMKRWYNDSSKQGTWVVQLNGRWYFNPAYAEVRQLIADGVTELLTRYDFDGAHIDDYFYPTTAASFDSAAFSASGASSLSSWRQDNASSMVKALYNATHAANASAVFSVSPQGNVSSNYNTQYADVRKWCAQSGYLDIIMPQIYYGFNNSTAPYAATVAEWNAMATAPGVKVVVGLAAYKLGVIDNYAGVGKTEWQTETDILLRQLTSAREQSRYGGVVLFRYDSLFRPAASVAAQVERERTSLANALR